MMLDLDLDSGHVKKLLVSKNSGKAVGVAFVKTEESNLGLEDLMWTDDNKEESLLVGGSLVLDPNEVEDKRNDMETDERQGSVEKDDSLEEEVELGDEAGGSLISKGVKFSSDCDFLSFMSEDEAVIKGNEKVSEEEGGRVTLYPVVKLKRLSRKDGLFEPNSRDGDQPRSKLQGRGTVDHVKSKAVWLPTLLRCLQPQVVKGTKKKSCGVSLSDVRANIDVQGKKGLQRRLTARKSTDASELQSSSVDVVDKHTSCQSNKYRCKLCDYSSSHRCNMKKHLEGTHSLGVGWDCEKCRKHFMRRSSFVKHTRKTKCAKGPCN